ncbi:hypothetical protein B0H16DRAFT_1587455 [Mycena metata]|uniref:CCHC-type domain-containing protein n=1 Tax=Mycena metata TaxID=1033252 RepID=A0AAD7MRA4_9AGAR|nr:hypothetical protein B0H16DRAFT_1587455 [Mycena metata]
MPELTDNNHYRWSFAFRAFAKTQGTKELYLGEWTCPTTGPTSKGVKAWQAKAALAAADLIAAVEESQYVHLRGMEEDPAAMWANLLLVHTTDQAATDTLTASSAFHDAKYTNFSIHLKTHIGNILEITDQLTTIFHDPPSPDQVIARILSSLPTPEFDDAIRFITTSTRVSDRTWVTAHLLKEEFILRRKGVLGGVIPDDGSGLKFASAMHATTAAAAASTPATVVPVTCSNCGRRGHVLEACFQPGGPKEGEIPDWYNKRHEVKANFTEVFAL